MVECCGSRYLEVCLRSTWRVEMSCFHSQCEKTKLLKVGVVCGTFLREYDGWIPPLDTARRRVKPWAIQRHETSASISPHKANESFCHYWLPINLFYVFVVIQLKSVVLYKRFSYNPRHHRRLRERFMNAAPLDYKYIHVWDLQ